MTKATISAFYFLLCIRCSGQHFINTNCTLADHLPCTITYYSACSYIPEVYRSDDVPGAPTNLHITRFLHGTHEDQQLGLNITWSPPSDSGIKMIKGFVIKLISKDAGLEQKCWHYNMSGAQWKNDDYAKQYVLHLSIRKGLRDNTEYLVQLKSLPQPRNENTSWKIINKTITFNRYLPSADNWESVISSIILDQTGNVSFNFTLAPRKFGFNWYQINLMKCIGTEESCHYDPVIRNITLNMSSVPRGQFSYLSYFKEVCEGYYQISVKPNDGGNQCQYNDCRTSYSSIFTVPNGACKTYIRTSEPLSKAIGFSCLGVVAASMLLTVLLWCRKKRCSTKTTETEYNIPADNSEATFVMYPERVGGLQGLDGHPGDSSVYTHSYNPPRFTFDNDSMISCSSAGDDQLHQQRLDIERTYTSDPNSHASHFSTRRHQPGYDRHADNSVGASVLDDEPDMPLLDI